MQVGIVRVFFWCGDRTGTSLSEHTNTNFNKALLERGAHTHAYAHHSHKAFVDVGACVYVLFRILSLRLKYSNYV